MGVSAVVATVADSLATVTVADVLTGAAVGAVVSGVTGGNPLTGALTGGLGGAIGDVVSGFGASQLATGAVDAGSSAGGFASGVGAGDLATQAGAGFGDVLAPSGFTINPLDVSSPTISSIGGAASSAPFANNLVGGVARDAATTPQFNLSAVGVNPSPTGTASSVLPDSSPAAGPVSGAQPASGGANLPSTTASPSGMPVSASDVSASNNLPASVSPAGGVDSAQTVSGANPAPSPSGLTGSPDKPFSFDTTTPPETAKASDSFVNPRNIGPTSTSSPTASPDGAGSGFIDSLGKQIKNNALTLGVGALSALNTPQMPKPLTPVAQNASQLQSVGKDLINKSQQGTITPAQQAKIENWRSQAIAQTKDFYARAGLGDSSMQQSAIDNINQQATAATEQIIQQNLTQGISALGQSDASNQTLANVKFQQDSQTQTMLSNLAKAIGSSSGQQPNTPTQ
jgi:hypothetical protein